MVLETGRLGGENGVILKKQSFNSVSDVMHHGWHSAIVTINASDNLLTRYT